MSWALLAQTPRPLAYLGGALCLAGVAVSRGRTRRSAAPETVPESASPEPSSLEPSSLEQASLEQASGQRPTGDPVGS
jgi:hypothetical protein